MKKNLLNFKTVFAALGILFSTTASAQYTAVVSGNWSSSVTWGGPAPTATVLGQDIIIPSGVTVNLDTDLTFTGLLNSLTINGVLTNSTVNGITMTQGALIGSGTISINKIIFMSTSTSSFLGNLNLKELVNSTTSLAFSAIANISDTLYLESGSILLNTNSNLTMASNSTVKVAGGSLSLIAGVFNSNNAYNVMYTGNSKTSGMELNTITLQNLYLQMNSNTQTVTLNNNTIINGNVNMLSGKLALNGKKLNLKGDLIMGTGSALLSNATSTLLVEGTGTLSSSLMFEAGSSINEFAINKAAGGQVKIASPLNVTGHLNLMDGNLSIESGAMLTMMASATIHIEKGNLSVNTGTFNGAAAYNVEYSGNANVVSGAELSGTGLNNVVVNYTNGSNKMTLANTTTVTGKLDLNKGMLDLNGKNLVLNGTISQNSAAAFIGNTSSELDLNLASVSNDTLFFDASGSSSQSLSKLKVNTTGTTSIVLGSKLVIATSITFTKGKIELTNGDLVILPAASIIGYDDNRYVITSANATGALVMNVVAGSLYVTFPIGLMSNYSPASVQQNAAATSGNFSARSSAMLNSTLKTVNRTWLIESSVTTINANLKLGWVAAAEANGFSRNNAYVSHFTSSAWDVVASGSATVAANSTFELSRNGITSLSPFAVVEQGEPLALKENLMANEIMLYPNPAQNVVNILSNNTSESYNYELCDLTGKTVMMSTSLDNNNKIDISKLESGCYFIKATNVQNHKITTKRFIKE